jgi:hypothetical protein
MTVTALGQQQYIGEIEKVYSRRFEGPEKYASGPLPFVGSPGSWGNHTLTNGERALVFVRWLAGSSRYYQDHWHGHFTIISIHEVQYAVANWHLLEPAEQPWAPRYLRDAAFQLDESKPWQVAMPYALLERHLTEEIDRLDASESEQARRT